MGVGLSSGKPLTKEKRGRLSIDDYEDPEKGTIAERSCTGAADRVARGSRRGVKSFGWARCGKVKRLANAGETGAEGGRSICVSAHTNWRCFQ